MKHRNVRLTSLIAATLMSTSVLVAPLATPVPAAASTRAMCPTQAASRVNQLDQLLAQAYPSQAMHAYNQGLDMRDDTGYNTDFLFGMTRAVASGPLTPVLKPLFFLLTVPLDIITLPFTAIAGFF